MKKILVLLIIVCFLSACSQESNDSDIEQIDAEKTVDEKTANNEQLQTEAVAHNHEKLEEHDDSAPFLNNSSGNIIAGGKYILLDNTLYFANLIDNNSLYKTNLDGTNSKKLTDHAVGNLHIHGDWLYYTPIDNSGEYPFPQSINKIKLDGSHEEVVLNQPVDFVHASGDYLLFILDGQIYKLKMNDDELINLPYQALTLSVSDNTIVYFNHDGYHLGDLQGEKDEPLFSESYGDYIVEGNELYFTKVGRESGLYRYSLLDKEVSHIITEGIDYFNVNGDTIYYSTATAEVDRSIYKVNKDGEQKQDLGTVIYSINIFDEYVIGEYARQGFVQYILINRENNEIMEIYPQ
ncbi:DUF5050 domain-containing protein [Oceanobacillus chungangensis]|uniref:Prolow-density lipoprotein receptor-related protein 1-like beta-propeller domain-containing protein n=1 Tax=Oceanobacillus chungangensis TaxID=1229152 RepID=A0A3D8PKU0_9BACI|nr:DUF5050 domain-containing protein [Oceanobacillus chungangensis]RDW16690.1 hypothetical protein CWR45_13750 [Oceanobacillus chungangensis]